MSENEYLRALNIQTEQMTRAVEKLGDRFDRGVESLRDGQAEVRKAIVNVAVLALVLMAAAMGITVRLGALAVGPAQAPTAQHPTPTEHR